MAEPPSLHWLYPQRDIGPGPAVMAFGSIVTVGARGGRPRVSACHIMLLQVRRRPRLLVAGPHRAPAGRVDASRPPSCTTSESALTRENARHGTGPSRYCAHLGSLRSTFSNLAPRLNTLVTRWERGVYRVSRRPDSGSIRDSRGPVVRRIENPQTFLPASEVDRLVDDYRRGASVNELAERYGVHRATVSAHLTRRDVPRRRPCLGVKEAAEAVRLHLDGVSIRSIARSMGVGRGAVRAALSEATVLS